MNKNFKLSGNIKKISFLLTVLAVSLALGNFVFAVWSEPGAVPPAGNVEAPINVSSAPQIKSGNLSVAALYDANDSNYYINPSATLTPAAIFAGNVGIGTLAPGAKLEVLGGEAWFKKTGSYSHFNYGANEDTYIRAGLAAGKVYINDSTAGNVFIATGGGNVGIGTTNPRTKLELGNDGSILAIGTSGSGWTEPNLGAGTRMMWYPKKSAFRAGSLEAVAATQWDDANIGNYSVAFGRNSEASGNDSFAAGNGAYATGDGSMALSSMAFGASKAAGVYTEASGTNSTAIGVNAHAGGFDSVAIGTDVQATGDNSMVLGLNFSVSGAGSIGIGESVGVPLAQDGTLAIMRRKVGIGTVTPNTKLEIGIDDLIGAEGLAISKTGVAASVGSYMKVTNAAGNSIFYIKGDGNVGIGTANPQGALDVSSTIGAFIVPRMTTAQRDALTPVNGMIIYNTSTNQFNFRENGAWVLK